MTTGTRVQLTACRRPSTTVQRANFGTLKTHTVSVQRANFEDAHSSRTALESFDLSRAVLELFAS